MADPAVDEMIAADEAFAGNHLLATLSPELRALVEPAGTIIELSRGDIAL